MAATVQYLMEHMIPELEELEKKGYFSRAEIKKIVQKRQDYEYRLKRRAALLEDFYRYIDFEMKLEELRAVRKQQLGIKGKKSLAETGIVRRIHFIYERATRKFRADLSLWMRWIAACERFRSSKQLSKVVAKALKRHSTAAALWIKAACWEFERNNNVQAARSLMQQGLRMCKKDEDMWVEYYRLELLYVAKLRLRRELLGLDVGGPGASEGADGGADSSAAARAVLSGAVARVVYKNAVAALPERLGFRVRFLAVLREFSFDGVEALRDQVYDSVRQDFAQTEEGWDVLARRHGGGSGAAAAAAGTDGGVATPFDPAAHKRACEVYGSALKAVPSAKMYELYGTYLGEVLQQLTESIQHEAELGADEAGDGGDQNAGVTTEEERTAQLVEVAAQLFSCLQAAHTAKCTTPQSYITWADWAEQTGMGSMAAKALRAGCDRFPDSVPLWRRRLQLERTQAQAGSSSSGHKLLASLFAALQATRAEADGATELWAMAAEELTPGSVEFGRLAKELATACARVAKNAPRGGLGGVAAAMVDKARSALGMEAARQLYGKLLAVPGAGGDLYRCAIRLEEAHAHEARQQRGAAASSSAADAACRRVTELYEAALGVHGATEWDLWLGYARWLAACGKGAGQVYWRATKALADADGFVEAYREMMAQQ